MAQPCPELHRSGEAEQTREQGWRGAAHVAVSSKQGFLLLEKIIALLGKIDFSIDLSSPSETPFARLLCLI